MVDENGNIITAGGWAYHTVLRLLSLSLQCKIAWETLMLYARLLKKVQQVEEFSKALGFHEGQRPS